MNGVAIVSILLGALVVCGRLPMTVAPAPTLRWFHRLVSSDSRLRVLGAAFALLGVAMIWVGSPADSELGGVVMFVGMWVLGGSLLLLVVFPAAYRSLVVGLSPRDPEGSLIGWRLAGLAGAAIGVAFVIAGVRAL